MHDISDLLRTLTQCLDTVRCLLDGVSNSVHGIDGLRNSLTTLERRLGRTTTRFYGSIPPEVNADLFPFMERVFRIVGMATVATSAEEARDLGFLRSTDRITIDPDAVLADAKADVLAMVATGYRPPQPKAVKVPGRDGSAALKIAIHTMKGGGYLSDYDAHLGRVLGSVLCGGDVPAGTVLTEQEFLDLERKAFVELCRQEKTMARIMHMLETGKPLRN